MRNKAVSISFTCITNTMKLTIGITSINGGLTTDPFFKHVKSRSKRMYLANTIDESTNFKIKLSTIKPTIISLMKYASSMIKKVFGRNG